MTSDRTTDAADERARARDMLDVQEGTGPVPVLDRAGAMALLRRARRIAVVGASPDPSRPSHGVMRYLLGQGFDCVPVNPRAPEILGRRSYPTLQAALETGPFDVVDVFRRDEHAPQIARDAVEIGAAALWLQLGVVSWEAAAIAHAAGIAVVMDRCTAIDHRALRADG